MNGAQALVRILEQLGVTHIFGVPGAKIDSVFIALLESPIELVVCRHEQNAAFLAAAMGRMTGKIGVCLVTSGPGVTNLATGLVTATSEGDPVLAIGGEVPLQDRLKHTHQAVDGVSVMRPVTKYAAEILAVHQIPEVLGNAVRAAESGRPGATFIALAKDVGLAEFPHPISPLWGRRITAGPAATSEIEKAIELLQSARKPMALLGLQASQPSLAPALCAFLAATRIPYVATLQGPGAWAQPADARTFAGRVGLFRNQPGDRLIAESDCLLTIGFDAVEYDPVLWNDQPNRPLIAMDVVAPDQDRAFLPAAELIGDLAATLEIVTDILTLTPDPDFLAAASKFSLELDATAALGSSKIGTPIHPLRVIHELRQVVTCDTTVALDIGSHYIWMCRYFPAACARQLLISNGQQTLGVALPWAMAANLARPGRPVISVSGDGGFLFSAMELETAVRLGCRFVHLIWNSNSYDMVAFQEEAHYHRTAGVALGHYDVPAYAAAFGCTGVRINHPDELAPALLEGLASPVPYLIDIPIDYSDNLDLMRDLHFGGVQ